jgi:predicted RNase H-like nuclease (RuvC/YqgF family)
VQVREQRAQLKKRAESVARIRDAQESLDARIGELEEALEDAQQRLDELKKIAAQARGSAARDSNGSPRHAVEPELPAYLRVEI